MKEELLLKLNLQFFGGDGEEGGGEENPNGDEEKGQEKEREKDAETVTLTPKELQAKIDSEKDKHAQKVWETKSAKLREEILAEIEAEKKKEKELSQLTEEERRVKELELERQKFEEEKEKFAFEKAVVDAKGALTEKGLPTSFATFAVVKGDNEATLANINLFEQEIEKIVAERLKESLRQNTPGVGGKQKTTTYKPMGLYSNSTQASADITKRAAEKFNL